MDVRGEPRIQCYQTVELTLLGDYEFTIPAHAIQLTGHSMRVVVNQPVEVDTPISIRAADWIAFGEVCYCQPERSHYAVGLQLDQTMMGLQDLDALMRNRLNNQRPNTA